MKYQVRNNIAEINRCSQRGGRMLSVIDLIERGTVDVTTAAFLACHISAGASFVVGAVPGGAGKTTVMGALLNLIPADRPIVAVDSDATIDALLGRPSPVCAVAHELSPGGYFGYIWGDAIRRFFQLAGAGHTVATNLHADNLDQALDQICRTGGTSAADLARVQFFLFLSAAGGYGCRTVRVSGIMIHDPVSGRHRPLTPADTIHPGRRQWEDLFMRLQAAGRTTIEAVREAVVQIDRSAS